MITISKQSTWLVALRTAMVALPFTAFWVGGLLYCRRFDGGIALPQGLAVAGLVIAVLGGLACLICVATFTVVGRGTPAPFDPPKVFVISGPYQYCRNPMLGGFCTMLVGLGLLFRSPAALVFAAFAVACGHLMVVLWEERHLRAKFGQSYIDYCARVPRWLPKFR